jgi:nucleotide-binding universal stress UspA family protein
MVAIDRILCPVDLSPCSRTALQYALALARWYEATVTVLHVVRPVPVVDTAAAALGAGIYAPPVVLPEVDRATIERRVAEFVAATPGAAGVTVHVCDGLNVREEILREAEQISADLLVLGSHGLTGVKRLVLGSIAENVLRHAARPVLIVPAHAPDVPPAGIPFTRIVCAVDFEADSYRALRYAFDLAQESAAQLTLLHAVEMPAVHVGAEDLTVDLESARQAVIRDARDTLETLVPESARAYCTVHAEVAEGQADKAVLRLATDVDADLIIMGVRHRDALDVAVFGSHVQAVVRAAHCPVLTVHQQPD